MVVLCNHVLKVGLPPLCFHNGGPCTFLLEAAKASFSQVSIVQPVYAGRSMDLDLGLDWMPGDGWLSSRFCVWGSG